MPGDDVIMHSLKTFASCQHCFAAEWLKVQASDSCTIAVCTCAIGTWTVLVAAGSFVTKGFTADCARLDSGFELWDNLCLLTFGGGWTAAAGSSGSVDPDLDVEGLRRLRRLFLPPCLDLDFFADKPGA